MIYILAINWDKFNKLDDPMFVGTCIREHKCGTGDPVWHGVYEDGYTPYVYTTKKQMIEDLRIVSFELSNKSYIGQTITPFVRRAILEDMHRQSQ